MLHRVRPIASLALVLALAATAALAEDVVHFSNGTYMKVSGYTLDGDMIKVTLGPGASMSFPKNLVQKIERAGHRIYPQTPDGPANVVAEGSGGGGAIVHEVAYPVTGEMQQNRGRLTDPGKIGEPRTANVAGGGYQATSANGADTGVMVERSRGPRGMAAAGNRTRLPRTGLVSDDAEMPAAPESGPVRAVSIQARPGLSQLPPTGDGGVPPPAEGEAPADPPPAAEPPPDGGGDASSGD